MRMLVPFLGCIADDITGATDLGSALVRRGLSTVQIFGVPNPDDAAGDEDAVVVALKTRTLPSLAAREQALRSLRWLQSQNIAHVYFKYCSTFDSTSAGNIGPVTDELLTALGSSQAIHCPAYPTNGRTLYQGHLFVGRSLLSESGMQDHPLTPMRDPNLVRVLKAQTPAAVDLLPLQTLQAGLEATGRLLEELARRGVRHIIADAIADSHVDRIAAARQGWRSSGVERPSVPPGGPLLRARTAASSLRRRACLAVLRQFWWVAPRAQPRDRSRNSRGTGRCAVSSPPKSCARGPTASTPCSTGRACTSPMDRS